MIDINKAKLEFARYTSEYDINNENIKRKILHTYRVMDCCKYIGERLNLDEDKLNLAMLIGLLHDIGRFEQMKLYNTYSDHKSIDHADYGVEILFENNLIKMFIDDNKYNDIILKAILNHNKLNFQKNNMSVEEVMFCNIIRDADKIDNMYIATSEDFIKILKVEDISNEIITEKVYNYILDNKLVLLKDIVTHIDFLMVYLGYIFDLNYKCSYEIIKSKEYISKIINRVNSNKINTVKRLNKIKIILEEYLDNKISK